MLLTKLKNNYWIWNLGNLRERFSAHG
jgi:hypothetical protein